MREIRVMEAVDLCRERIDSLGRKKREVDLRGEGLERKSG